MRRVKRSGPKVVVNYAESYRAPGLKIRADCLPLLRHTGFEAFEAYITRAGLLMRGEEHFEFQDVRIYLRPTPSADAGEAK